MNPTPTNHQPKRLLDGEGIGKRALITGLCGFTGRYLAQDLADAGYEVFGTALPGEGGGPNSFRVATGTSLAASAE